MAQNETVDKTVLARYWSFADTADIVRARKEIDLELLVRSTREGVALTAEATRAARLAEVQEDIQAITNPADVYDHAKNGL